MRLSATVKNKCCLKGMKKMQSESIDLIVTDPPYLIDYKSGGRKDSFRKIENDKDGHDLIKKFIAEAYRVLKNDSAIYMFCSWHHIDFFKSEFEKHFKLKNIIVWNKNNHGSGDLEGAYAPKHEFVLFGHKGRALFKSERIPDVINCQKVPGEKMTHPTEKPIHLLEVFIKNNSNENDIVLDCFSGTGSTGIAAINLNRNFIGFEIDDEYCVIANKRINAALSNTQLRLFQER